MTTNVQSNVLERLTSLWNVPPHERSWDAPPVRLYRDRTIPAAVICETLLREFRESEIRAAITGLLASIVAEYERDATPEKDQLFLADCCTQLIAQPDGIRVETELVARIVCLFPTPGWYSQVAALVARYLTKGGLLRVLLEGMVRPPHPDVVMNCLAAVRLYSKGARMDPDPHALTEIIDKIRKKVSDLSRSEDAETAHSARLALRHLDILEHEQPPHL